MSNGLILDLERRQTVNCLALALSSVSNEPPAMRRQLLISVRGAEVPLLLLHGEKESVT